VSNILMPEDPAFQLYERLVDALGTGPVHTADESARSGAHRRVGEPGGLRRAHAACA
jgi:hypothetical protein